MDKNYKVKRYGYDSYRKNKKKRVFSFLTVALIAAAALVGWFAYEPIYNYIMQIRTGSSSESSSIVPSSSDSSSAQQEPSSEPQSFPERLDYVLPDKLSDAAGLADLFSSVKASGADGIVIELKGSDGIVHFNSSSEQAAANLALSASAYDLEAVLSAARDAGLTVVGRIWAFRDPAAARMMSASAVKYDYGEIKWLDDSLSNGGKPWLNPNDPAAQQYIVSLVTEASGRGVQHIVLAGVQFPDGYSLNKATYAAKGVTVDRSGVLAGFLVSARSAAEANGASLWTTVDLLSTTGVKNNRYGSDLARVIAATEKIVLDVTPAQFGAGVSVGGFSLTAPVLTPYETVKTSLEASAVIDLKTTDIIALVQGYTDQTLTAGNKTYTEQDVSAQINACNEFGIDSCIVYDPF